MKYRHLVISGALFSTLLVNQVTHAGYLKKALTFTVVAGLGAVAIYKAGQASERRRYDEEKSLFDPSVLQDDLKRLRTVSSALWTQLASQDLTDGDAILNQAKDLRRSADISMLDTAAFAYASLGDRETAIEIYQYRIFPKLILEDDATLAKYESHYAVLISCEPKHCIRDLYQ